MRKLVAIAFCGLTIASAAQYIGGTGGGGATNCSSVFAMLPVELLHFSATAQGKEVQLQWATASELNNAGFHVERSSDGVRFEAIAEVEGMGTTPMLTQYETLDRAPLPGLSYYRLRQTDLDGTVIWSKAVAVMMSIIRTAAYPNPVRSMLTVQGPWDNEDRSVDLFDAQGRSVRQATLRAGANEIDMAGLPAGLYRLRISWAQGAETLSVMKE